MVTTAHTSCLGPGSSRRLQCTHTVRICKAYHMRAHVRRCTHSFLTLATPGTSACSSISAASSPDPDVRPHTTAAAILIQETRCATSDHLYKYGCLARRREREQLISEKARGGASILGRAHEAEELPREPLTCRFVLVQPHLPLGHMEPRRLLWGGGWGGVVRWGHRLKVYVWGGVY